MMDYKLGAENQSQPAALDASQISEVSQVAWLRVGALGDLLVALACLEETLALFPRATIFVFGPKLWLEILRPQLWPRVNGIIVIEGKSEGRLYRPVGETWQAEKTALPLQKFFKSCQASVNLRVESYRFAWPALFAGVKYRFGTCPPQMSWLYTHWSPWLGKDPVIHERDRLLRILEATPLSLFRLQSTQNNRDDLKLQQTGVRKKKADKNQVFQPEQDRKTLSFKWRDRALPRVVVPDSNKLKEDFGLEGGQFWLVNPTASRWEKAWPREKFREFVLKARVLAEERGRKIIIVGAPNETEWLEAVAGSEFQIVQPKNIGALSNLVALAELLVTNTSSVQFLAATTKTPTLVLMGRTFPARWGPLGSHDHFIPGRLSESPPDDIFLDDFQCYDTITVKELLSEFRAFIERLPMRRLDSIDQS